MSSLIPMMMVTMMMKMITGIASESPSKATPKSTKLTDKIEAKKKFEDTAKKLKATAKDVKTTKNVKKAKSGKATPIYMTETQYIEYLKKKNALPVGTGANTSMSISTMSSFPPADIKEGEFREVKTTAWQSPTSAISLKKNSPTDIVPFNNNLVDNSSDKFNYPQYNYPLQKIDNNINKPILVNRDNPEDLLSVKDFEKVGEVKSPANISIRQYSRGSDQKSPIVTIVQ